MFSKKAAERKIGNQEGFRWRGEEISRIEGLSDAVFAFAVTLLIVSTEVPKTFDDLILSLRAFFPFAACFVQIMLVWYNHYIFYRRYNLQDVKSVALTMTLLFVILFYTYPLKFVFMAWFTQMMGPLGPGDRYTIQNYGQLSELFTIYALGFIAVYVVFFFMYVHAYRSRKLLALTELEIWDTKHEMRESVIFCCIGLLSLTLANTLSGRWVGLAGFIYSIIGIVVGIHESWGSKRRKVIFLRLYPDISAVPATM